MKQGEGAQLRRWLWPYAILATLLSLIGVGLLLYLLFGKGAEHAGADLTVANAVAIEPLQRFMVSALEMIAPFELPQWFKEVYATLALVAVDGLLLSSVMGLLLLPVFYALYRGARRGD